MATIIDPLLAAGIAFSLGMAAISLFPRVEGEMEGKMIFRLMLAPACLAVLILVLDGVADHLYFGL